MTITVKNNTEQEIKVAISHWGSDGNTDFFSVKPADSESWGRSDERGFLVVVKKTCSGSSLTYFVQYDYDIVVSKDNVKNKNSIIHPIS